MMALVSIARLQASKLDSLTRAAANEQWDLWLHGDNKVARRSSLQPTKRAFLYVKGSVGWTRSPIGSGDANETVLGEYDPYHQQELFDQEWCARRLWSRLPDELPLCGQAAVEGGRCLGHPLGREESVPCPLCR